MDKGTFFSELLLRVSLYRRLRKNSEKVLLASPRLSVRPAASPPCTSAALTTRTVVKFDKRGDFREISNRENFKYALVLFM